MALILGWWDSTWILPSELLCHDRHRDRLGPLAVVGPRAGSARCAQTRPLSAATTLGTRCTLSSSEFPFSVFVSFLLTLFPSGTKGWMGPMVTGWCEQPDPTVGVTAGRAQQHPAPTRAGPLGRRKRAACPRVPQALPESGAGSRNLLSRCLQMFSVAFPGGRRQRPLARSRGSLWCVLRPPQDASASCEQRSRRRDLGRAGAHPERLRLLEPSCRRRRRAQPLGPDPATQEPRAR